MDCGLIGSAELPLTLSDEAGVIAVGIDGGTAKLLLDTGATQSVLTQAAAARIGLRADPARTRDVSGSGGSGTYPIAQSREIRLGNAAIKGVTFVLVPFPIEMPGQTLDGLLGMDALSTVDLDLDYPNGRATIWLGKLCPGQNPPWPHGATEIAVVARYANPLHPPDEHRSLLPTDRLLLPVVVDDAAALAIIDSGANHIVVTSELAARAGVSNDTLSHDPAFRSHGLSTAALAGRVHHFRRISIGDSVLTDPIAWVEDLKIQGIDMILGVQYLRTHRVWISFNTGRLFVDNPMRPDKRETTLPR